MSDRHVKLTETLAVKIDGERLAMLRGLAELDGVETPELVRQLIDHHIEIQKARHSSLDSIFGQIRTEPK